jgi:hypothetical protein
MIASALLARGKTLGYTAAENTAENAKKRYGKIRFLSDAELEETKGENFFLLSSTSVYEQSISVALKKEILAKFNQRSENIHGELARFIVMDSGFKEGIDLFDIKYIHRDHIE